jgi:5-methylcytosine-specific restriction protein A
MGLADITRAGVLQAIEECDRLGRDEFLQRYGFKPARQYVLIHNGGQYDSKAICGVAHRFDRPDEGILEAGSFSGGRATVGARLAKLGFVVLAQSDKAGIVDDDGNPVRATCEIVRDGDHWAVTLHSRGGTIGTASERNPGYKDGLQLLLRRLAFQRATIVDALVDSEQTSTMPVVERRLLPDLPRTLQPEDDVVEIARALMSTAALITPSGRRTSGGNPTKQIRILFTMDSITSVRDIESMLVGTRPPENVFILTWNPNRWHISDEDLDDYVGSTQDGQAISSDWSTGNRTGRINPGDHVFLFRQEDERGLVAHGVATSKVYKDIHFEDPTRLGNNIDVSWVTWLATEDRLPIDQMASAAPNTHWNAMLGSGVQIAADDARSLLDAWRQWVGDLRGSLPGDEAVGGFVTEGAVKKVSVNRYERNAAARRTCIAAHGAVCAVCDLDFSQMYGDIGDGFIHVHHLVQISTVGSTYELDPVIDLVPVCPNCHAMLHRGVDAPRTIDELRQLIH